MAQFTNAVNTDWTTSLLAISKDQFLTKLQDNIFDKSVIFQTIKQNSQVIINDGGPQLQVPLMVSKNTGVNSLSGYDVVDTSPQSGFIDGTIGKAYYAAPITISNKEEEENGGDAQVVNLLAGRTMQAEQSMTDRLNQDLYLDGTGNGGKNLTGLLLMVPSASGAGTYMGVNGGTVTAWDAQYQECASANIISGASSLDSLWYRCSDGTDQPDIVVTDDVGITLYEQKNRTSGVGISYVNASMADAGFKAVAYKGVPMVSDKGQGTGVYHMLNSKYLGFYYKSDLTDFVRPANQLAKVSLVSVVCQLVSNNRRRQGKLILS